MRPNFSFSRFCWMKFFPYCVKFLSFSYIFARKETSVFIWKQREQTYRNRRNQTSGKIYFQKQKLDIKNTKTPFIWRVFKAMHVRKSSASQTGETWTQETWAQEQRRETAWWAARQRAYPRDAAPASDTRSPPTDRYTWAEPRPARRHTGRRPGRGRWAGGRSRWAALRNVQRHGACLEAGCTHCSPPPACCKPQMAHSTFFYGKVFLVFISKFSTENKQLRAKYDSQSYSFIFSVLVSVP